MTCTAHVSETEFTGITSSIAINILDDTICTAKDMKCLILNSILGTSERRHDDKQAMLRTA